MNEALRDRVSRLNSAILRINSSLDVSIVLQEVVESVWRLSQFGPYSQRGKIRQRDRIRNTA